MAELNLALADLERSLNNPEATTKTGDALVKFIVESRSKNIQKIADVVRCAAADPRLKAHPELAKTFNDKLQSIRREAASIQAKYRATDIAAAPADYSQTSRATAQRLTDFCRWALTSLETL